MPKQGEEANLPQLNNTSKSKAKGKGLPNSSEIYQLV